MKTSGNTSSKRINPASAGIWVLFLLLTAVPLVFSLVYALLYSFGLTGVLAEGFTLRHWQLFFSEGRFFSSFLFSVGVALVSMGLAAATALWWVLRYRRALNSRVMSLALYLPLAFPAMVAAFLAFHWLGNAGLLSRIAWQLGWISEPRQFPDLINDPWGIGIILTHYAMATPFFTLMFKAIYADNRVGELCLAGASMGATRSEQVRRIALPLLWQKARPTLLLYGVFVAGSYEIPLILGVQSPQMISVYAVTKMNRFDLNTRPQAYIIALLFTVIVGGLLRWGMGRGR